MYANRYSFSGDRNMIKKEAEKILMYKHLTIEIQCMWNVKTNVIPVIIGATASISVIQKIPEQHTRKAQNEGTTESGCIGHGTHTSESTNVKVQEV
jgi:hypothetical protein